MTDSMLNGYWSSRADSYDRFVVKGFADMRERRSWQALYSEALGVTDGKVLDTGCGPGIVSMQLADLGFDVTALDFSETMLQKAEANAVRNGLPIAFVRGDAADLPFGDGSFDIVVSDYMLWTVNDPKKVMAEWYRVLMPGGHLVYVDGDWSHDPRSTRLRCRIAAWAAKKDDPLRDEQGDSAIMSSLWSYNAVRPADDISMLSDAGFTDISVRHNIQKKVLHGIRYLAHGLTNDHFMVSAYKPEVKN